MNTWFKFHFEWLEGARCLRDEERLRLLDAVVDYARTGRPPDLTGPEAGAFWIIAARIQRDHAQQSGAAASARENGARGGRPRKSAPAAEAAPAPDDSLPPEDFPPDAPEPRPRTGDAPAKAAPAPDDSLPPEDFHPDVSPQPPQPPQQPEKPDGFFITEKTRPV